MRCCCAAARGVAAVKSPSRRYGTLRERVGAAGGAANRLEVDPQARRVILVTPGRFADDGATMVPVTISLVGPSLVAGGMRWDRLTTSMP